MLSTVAPVSSVPAVRAVEPVQPVGCGGYTELLARQHSTVSALPFGSITSSFVRDLSPQLNEFLVVGRVPKLNISYKEFHEWNLELASAVDESNWGESLGTEFIPEQFLGWTQPEIVQVESSAGLFYSHDIVQATLTAKNWWSKGAFQQFATAIVLSDENLSFTVHDVIDELSRADRIDLWRAVVSSVIADPEITSLSGEAFKQRISEVLRDFVRYKVSKQNDRKGFHTNGPRDDARERVHAFDLMTGVSPPVAAVCRCRRQIRGERDAQIFKSICGNAIPNGKCESNSLEGCAASALRFRCAQIRAFVDRRYRISSQFTAYQNERVETYPIHGPSRRQFLDHVSVA